MTARNLLHKTKIPEFRSWLIKEGHKIRETDADYQLFQIRLLNDPTWHSVYWRDHMPEHVTVVQPLVKVVQRFIQVSHKMQRPSPTAVPATPTQPR